MLWFGIAIVVVAAIDTIPVPAGMDTFMDSMIEEYRSADYLPLYWFAMVTFFLHNSGASQARLRKNSCSGDSCSAAGWTPGYGKPARSC